MKNVIISDYYYSHMTFLLLYAIQKLLCSLQLSFKWVSFKLDEDLFLLF